MSSGHCPHSIKLLVLVSEMTNWKLTTDLISDKFKGTPPQINMISLNSRHVLNMWTDFKIYKQKTETETKTVSRFLSDAQQKAVLLNTKYFLMEQTQCEREREQNRIGWNEKKNWQKNFNDSFYLITFSDWHAIVQTDRNHIRDIYSSPIKIYTFNENDGMHSIVRQ